MIDDTPQVKWSNAWWGMLFLGFLVPAGFLTLWLYCLIADKAFAIGILRYRGLEIETVSGLQATLMMTCYICIALASFSYGFGRHNRFLCLFYDKILAVSLLGAAVSIAWCSFLFVA